MKLFIKLSLLVFTLLVTKGYFISIKKGMDRSEMIKLETENSFKNFSFKEKSSSSGWGDLVNKSDLKKDPFTGAIISKAENIVNSINGVASRLKKLANLKLKKSNDYVKNGDNLNGPLERASKLGLIYSPDTGGLWSGQWDSTSASSSSSTSASNASSDSSSSSSSASDSSQSSASNYSASAEESASVSAMSASSSSAASMQSSNRQYSKAELIERSGMNGGTITDNHAAGSTSTTDAKGNRISGFNRRKKSSSSAYSASSASVASSSSNFQSAASSSSSSSMGISSSSNSAYTSQSANQGFQMSNQSAQMMGSQGFYAREFECKREDIVKAIDPKYNIIKLMEKKINEDNSVRFFCIDTTTSQTVILKVFFKGLPHNCEFYNQLQDNNFNQSGTDCKNNRLLNNRLYGLPDSYIETDRNAKKGKPRFDDILFPQCTSDNSLTGGINTFYQVYTLPQGENLKKKCIVNNKINSQNSCMPFLKTIAKGILHGIELFNSGERFFLHGNITPENIYLEMSSNVHKVFLDNPKFDSNIFDDTKDKPASNDMNQLGDTLLFLLIGTQNSELLREPIKDAFDLYVKLKKYILRNDIDVNLKNQGLNVPLDIDSTNSKVVTLEEYQEKLSGSIFDFIYRLKNRNVVENHQFDAVSQALKHEFLNSLGVPIKLTDGSYLPNNVRRSLESLGTGHSDY